MFRWIDVVKLERRLPMDLYDGFAASLNVMTHIWIEVSEAPRRKISHLALVEGIAHPHQQGTGDDRHVLAFFLTDPCLENVRRLPEFEVLGSTLQAKYPSHLGLL